MRKRLLGSTGIEVTEIGFGASGFWGDRLFNERDALQVLRTAMEEGIRFVDTGANYSGFNAEPRLGKCLKQLFSEVPRDQWVLSSKGGTLSAAGSPMRLLTREKKDFSPQHIRQSINESIKRLGCGYLDIFFLHGFTQQDAADELLTSLEKLKRDGVIRAIGVNTHTPADMSYIASRNDVFDVGLIDYNLIARDREPYIDEMRNAGLGVIAGTVLAQGHLLPNSKHRPTSVRGAWYWARANLKPSARALQRACKHAKQELLKRTDLTPAQQCFEFVLENPAISSAIFGTTRPEHIREICAISD